MIVDVYKAKNTNNIYEIYGEVSKELFDRNLIANIDGFLNELKEREELGPIKIYEDVYLPHLLTPNITETSVVRVDNFADKVLFIIVNENDIDNKKKAQRIVSNLLEKEYADNLFGVEAETFKEIINRI